MKRSNGTVIGGNRSRRRVMNHSKANARIAQARNICERAMLTSGIVTPSIVNQRAARPSLIASDSMREENFNCNGPAGEELFINASQRF
jgi:hypothetical protein